MIFIKKKRLIRCKYYGECTIEGMLSTGFQWFSMNHKYSCRET